jgi:hypothetical protein
MVEGFLFDSGLNKLLLNFNERSFLCNLLKTKFNVICSIHKYKKYRLKLKYILKKNLLLIFLILLQLHLYKYIILPCMKYNLGKYTKQ